MSGYLDYSGRDDMLSGGAQKVEVNTPAGPYRVWVKRVGNRPDLRVLLLHGGPGATHEYFVGCSLPARSAEPHQADRQVRISSGAGLRSGCVPRSITRH